MVARREKWGAFVLLLPFFFFISAEVIAQTRDVKRISVPGVPIKILPENKDFPAPIQKYGPIYSLTTIPKGTYMGVDVDVPIIGGANLLACLESFADPLAYRITKEIFAHKPDWVAVVKSAEYLTPEAAVVGSPLPFRKGAIQYWEEKGIQVR